MCDCLVALPSATHGATLFAKNSDRPPTEVQRLEWCAPRFDDVTTRTTYIEIEPHPGSTFGAMISRAQWCWGAEHGVNTAGVAVGNEAIYTTLDPRSAVPGLIGMDLVRLALERAGDAEAAIAVITALLERYGQGGSGHDPHLVPAGRPYWSSFLVADPYSAYVLETSGTSWAVEKVEEVRAISNRTTIAGFDSVHRHPRQPVERLVDPRWQAGRELLRERPVTRAAMAAHLRSHDSCGEPGWSVCMHVDGIEATTSSMIAVLRAGALPEVWALTGHPCEQEYERWSVQAGLVERLPAAPTRG